MRDSFIVEDPPIPSNQTLREKEIKAKDDHYFSSATKVSQGLTLITTSKLGPKPSILTCPTCKTQIVTETRPVIGLLTWLVSIPFCIICPFVGCTSLCGLIPFCITDTHDIQHFCPHCASYIGTYVRFK
ncbi:unnamed protein product [Gordionus sp. m RMFG-2023]